MAASTALYRFQDTTAPAHRPACSAILDTDGKLTLMDRAGTLEVWDHYRHYMKDVMGVTASGNLEDDVETLAAILGPAFLNEEIDMFATNGKSKKPAAAKPAKTEARKPAAAKPAAKPAKKSAAAEDEQGPLPLCGCGCGDRVLNRKRQFLQGHDARFHSYIKRYQRGDMKFNELNETVQKYVRKEGIKQHS